MAEPQAAYPKSTQSILDLTGRTVGRFAIRARLGAGGMGEVYRADDTKLKRSVAIKRMAPALRTDQEYRQRFLKEAERASCLSDHHIAGVYDVLEEDDETFLVMEYVEGATLRQRLAGPFGLAEFLPVAIQCAEALRAAHEKGVVHRDIKPENVMLTPKGQVKILDFGVAKRLLRPDDDTSSGSTVSGPGALSGTPAYMAPEALLGKGADERSDLFSVGVVFYEMLAGRHPFRAGSAPATIDRILHGVPAPLRQLNPQVPDDLERIVAKLLAKDLAGRYATAAELLVDLHALERAEPPPGLLTDKVSRRAMLKRTAAVLCVAAVASLLLIATIPEVQQRIRRYLGVVEVPQKKHLAVLPFVSLGGGPETAAFSNGLTETLNARLTQLTEGHPLQVVPSSEVRAQSVTSVDQARREFGVNLVVVGTLQRSGTVVRITYALVDANARRQLRADAITAAASDPFAVEDRVVASVLDNLEIELQPPERRALALHGTREPAAYEDYLRGRGYLQDYHKPENIESAIEVFQRALEQDPRYALAYAGLGEAYWKKYLNSKDPQWVEPTRRACEQAAGFDTRLAAAQVCLGNLHNGAGQFEKAREEFQRALELDPRSDDAYRGLATAYQRLGKLKEAEQTYLRGIELRPSYWATYNWLGDFYTRTGRYADAARLFERVIQLTPDNYRGYYNLGATYYFMERWPDAEQMFKKSLALEPSATAYSNLGTLYFFQGRYREAARAFEKAVALTPMDQMIWGNLADAYRWIPGQAAMAAETYRRAMVLAEEQLKVNPQSAETLANLALYHAKTGQKAKAIQSIRRATTLEPDHLSLLYYAALVYHLAGDQGRSFALLKRVVERGYPVKEIRADPEWGEMKNHRAFRSLVGSP